MDVGNKKWACVKLLLDEQGVIEQVTSEPMPFLPAPDLTDDCLLAVADVPIGLLEDSKARFNANGNIIGRRPVDEAAQAWCLHHGSASAPPTEKQYLSGLAEHARAAAAATKDDKRRKLKNVIPRGMSCQALEMIPAIESAAEIKKLRRDRFYESHSEVAFTAIAGGVLRFNKRTLSGSIARAMYLSKRLKRDCVRWVIKQEAQTKIKADDWLDALAMAIVAYDWRVVSNRWMLRDEDGVPRAWSGETNFLMALPVTDLRKRPVKLPVEAVTKMVMAGQKPMKLED